VLLTGAVLTDVLTAVNLRLLAAAAALATLAAPLHAQDQLPEAPLPQEHASLLLPEYFPAPSSSAPDTGTSQATILPRYIPRKSGNTFAYFAGSLFSVRNLIEASLVASTPDLPKAPTQPQPPPVLDAISGPAYETALTNYGTAVTVWSEETENELRIRGRRAGVGLAVSESRNVLQNFILPLPFRINPRYQPANLESSFGVRMGHAIISPFVTQTRHGTHVPNIPKLGGTVGAAFAGQREYAHLFDAPELNTTSFLEKEIAFPLAGDIATNVARELLRSAVRGDLINLYSRGPAYWNHYYPLSVPGKFAVWMQTTYSPRHFISAGLIASIPKLYDQPDPPIQPPINSVQDELAYDQVLAIYGNNLLQWRHQTEESLRYTGRRAIGGFAESETQGFLQYAVLPSVLRQDGRFIPMGGGYNVFARIAHAGASIAVTRTNSGHRTVNASLLGGTVGAALIAQHVYYPQLNTPSLANNNVAGKTIGINLAADVILNTFHELCAPRYRAP